MVQQYGICDTAAAAQRYHTSFSITLSQRSDIQQQYASFLILRGARKSNRCIDSSLESILYLGLGLPVDNHDPDTQVLKSVAAVDHRMNRKKSV